MEISLCTEITLYMWRIFYLLQTCAVIVFSYVSYDVYFFRKLQIFYKNGFAVWTTPFIAQSQYESVSVFSRAPVYKGRLLCYISETKLKPLERASAPCLPRSCILRTYFVQLVSVSLKHISSNTEDKGSSFTNSQYLVFSVYCFEVEVKLTFITKFNFAIITFDHICPFPVVLWKGNLICNVILTKANLDWMLKNFFFS